jgi:hypothetical protein
MLFRALLESELEVFAQQCNERPEGRPSPVSSMEPGRPRPVSPETRLLRILARETKLRFDFLDNLLGSAS